MAKVPFQGKPGIAALVYSLIVSAAGIAIYVFFPSLQAFAPAF